MIYNLQVSDAHFSVIWNLLLKTQGLTAETTFPVMDALKRQVEAQEAAAKAAEAEAQEAAVAARVAAAVKAVESSPP